MRDALEASVPSALSCAQVRRGQRSSAFGVVGPEPVRVMESDGDCIDDLHIALQQSTLSACWCGAKREQNFNHVF